MGRKRRGRVRKDVTHKNNTGLPAAMPPMVTLADRDWDLDEIDVSTIAVDTILEALEGLWFETDDPVLERDVNDLVQSYKRQIQEML